MTYCLGYDGSLSLDTLESLAGYPVEDTVEFEKCTIVLFESTDESPYEYELSHQNHQHEEDTDQPSQFDEVGQETNICALDADGEVRWVIEQRPSGNPEARYTEIGTSLEPRAGNDVWVRHSDGRVEDGDRFEESLWVRHTNRYAFIVDTDDGTLHLLNCDFPPRLKPSVCAIRLYRHNR